MLYAIGDNGADIEGQFDLFSTFKDIVHFTFDELMDTASIVDRNAGIKLFFPYNLWNKHVEKSSGLYGGKGYKADIITLKNLLRKKLNLAFPEAMYVNQPDLFALERDKHETKNFLSRHGVSVIPEISSDISTIKEELENGNCIYVKVRYGSMGKGITRLEKNRWLTNFKYDNGEIENHPSDFEWKTIDVTDNYPFLEKLLLEDVLVEKGVETPKELGSKFDVRGVFVYSRLAELYGRSSPNPLITNLSQGGGCLEFNDLIELVGISKLSEAVQEMHDTNRVIGANLIGVDLTFDENLKPHIMEVNSFPGLGHGINEENIRGSLLNDVYSNLICEYTKSSSVYDARTGYFDAHNGPHTVVIDG